MGKKLLTTYKSALKYYKHSEFHFVCQLVSMRRVTDRNLTKTKVVNKITRKK